jgi:hypothetical protein
MKMVNYAGWKESLVRLKFPGFFMYLFIYFGFFNSLNLNLFYVFLIQDIF